MVKITRHGAPFETPPMLGVIIRPGCYATVYKDIITGVVIVIFLDTNPRNEKKKINKPVSSFSRNTTVFSSVLQNMNSFFNFYCSIKNTYNYNTIIKFILMLLTSNYLTNNFFKKKEI